MARIAVVGAGYVGLTAAACLASLKHDVTCIEADRRRVQRLRAGRVDIMEPRLDELVRHGVRNGHLKFVGDRAAADAEFVFMCLPTPMADGGRVDTTSIDSECQHLRAVLEPGCVVVVKSTTPIGTARRLARAMRRPDLHVVSNPEFLRQGRAVDDFLAPDRVVIGSDDATAAQLVAGLYARLGAPIVCMDTISAELTKYAANGFLAMRLSFINEIADLCGAFGADLDAVTAGLVPDPRIGSAHLRPGPGWGGSCLPKDAAALLYSADCVGVDMPTLRGTIVSNDVHRARIVRQITDAMGGGPLLEKRVGVLGLTCKAGTDDLRDSPAMAVARCLTVDGIEVTAHDPGVTADVLGRTDGIRVVADAYLAAKDADVVAVLTDWPQFRHLDWTRVAELVARPVVVDTRNCLDPYVLTKAGLVCHGAGSLP